MSEDSNSRFKFQNKDQDQERIKNNVKFINDKNKVNSFGPNNDINTMNYLGQRSIQVSQMQNSRLNISQISQIQRQKDRQIRKLTNVNKHLLQQLKQQNEQLTQKVNKQRFKFPKKSGVQTKYKKSQENGKQLQALKKQLENVYRQIQFYKDNINILKAKQISIDDKDKLNQGTSKLKQQNQAIQKLQTQIKTHKIIKQNQDKQLGRINSPQIIELIKNLDLQTKKSKQKIKQVKKNLIKRQQLQKKQHTYYLQLQALIKRTKNQQQKQQEQQKRLNQVHIPIALEQQVTQQQWKQVKQKLNQQKKKYQEYGKKYNYLIFLKSKQSKLSQQLQLKHKQKLKILQKLKSKLQQVNKLARLRPKPQIMQRVDIKMEKLKDIISRQNSIDMTNSSKQRNRIQSEDVRKFKKWQIQHAARQNGDSDEQFQSRQNNIKNNQIHYQLQNQNSSDYRISNINTNSQLQVV